MNRDRILEKIQKCLNLGKSPNEHEAAAALRQAQKMMEKHGVTDAELGSVGYGLEKVDCAIQAGKKVPVTLDVIIALMKHAFGVKAVIGRSVRVSDASFTVSYFGPVHRAMLAAYAHTIVSRAVARAWAQHLKDNPQHTGKVGGRAGFYAGWIDSVYETVHKFAMTDEDKVGTELAIEKHYGYELNTAKVSNTRIASSTVHAGSAAAAGFSLHTPMNGRESVKIGHSA